MMRGLVTLGVVLIIAGAATLFWLLLAIPRPDVAGGQASSDVPSMGWSLLAGLALAAGLACVGVGMNRWYQYRPRTIRRPRNGPPANL